MKTHILYFGTYTFFAAHASHIYNHKFRHNSKALSFVNM